MHAERLQRRRRRSQQQRRQRRRRRRSQQQSWCWRRSQQQSWWCAGRSEQQQRRQQQSQSASERNGREEERRCRQEETGGAQALLRERSQRRGCPAGRPAPQAQGQGQAATDQCVMSLASCLVCKAPGAHVCVYLPPLKPYCCTSVPAAGGWERRVGCRMCVCVPLCASAANLRLSEFWCCASVSHLSFQSPHTGVCTLRRVGS